MPKLVKQLTETEVKRARKKVTDYYLRDGRGLSVKVSRSGAKTFILNYINKATQKRTNVVIGAYPDISLEEAREIAEEIRQKNKRQKAIGKFTKTFGELAKEYFAKNDGEFSLNYWKSERTRYAYLQPIEHYTLRDLCKDDIVDIAKKIQDNGAIEQGHRVFNLAKRILDFAVANDYIETNFLAGVPKHIVLKNKKTRNYAHIVDKKELGKLLADIDNFDGKEQVRIALQLAPLLFVRPSNLRLMEWDEIDFDEMLWRIPAEKMKMDKDHIVPLSMQSLKLVKDAYSIKVSTKYVFPSPIYFSRPISENIINDALKKMGYKDKMTAHGFRHTASTILHENMHKHKIPSEVIELQMAHTDKNSIRATYNKAQYIELRMELMQWYADYLDAIKNDYLATQKRTA